MMQLQTINEAGENLTINLKITFPCYLKKTML